MRRSRATELGHCGCMCPAPSATEAARDSPCSPTDTSLARRDRRTGFTGAGPTRASTKSMRRGHRGSVLRCCTRHAAARSPTELHRRGGPVRLPTQTINPPIATACRPRREMRIRVGPPTETLVWPHPARGEMRATLSVLQERDPALSPGLLQQTVNAVFRGKLDHDTLHHRRSGGCPRDQRVAKHPRVPRLWCYISGSFPRKTARDVTQISACPSFDCRLSDGNLWAPVPGVGRSRGRSRQRSSPP